VVSSFGGFKEQGSEGRRKWQEDGENYVTRNFIVSIPCQVLVHLNDQTKDERVGRACSTFRKEMYADI
jgi:hypothetical protein